MFGNYTLRVEKNKYFLKDNENFVRGMNKIKD